MDMNILGNFKTFLDNSKHVMSVSYKPGRHEFQKTAKIIILGILAVGLLGFVIALLIGLLTGSSM